MANVTGRGGTCISVLYPVFSLVRDDVELGHALSSVSCKCHMFAVFSVSLLTGDLSDCDVVITLPLKQILKK